MDRLIKEGLILLAIGAAVLFGLSQINYLKILRLDSSKGNAFEYLGKFYLEDLAEKEIELKDSESRAFIDSLRNRICLANGLDTSKYQIYFFDVNEFNAYAIPGNAIILNSEVVRFAENADEVAGVLCHEIAHHEKDHVRKGVMGQLGIQILLVTITGTINENLSGLIAQLGWSKYSRSNEQEADDVAVKYLMNAKINPKHMANLFDRMAKELEGKQSTININVDIFDSHPETKARAKRIRTQLKNQTNYKSAYDQEAFEDLKSNLNTKGKL